MGEVVRFAGVDLAAQPATTAVAVLAFTEGRAVVEEIVCPADDEAILRIAEGCVKVGIDAPLGWPDRFVDYLGQHRAGTQESMDAGPAGQWLDERTYRVTDLRLRADSSPALRRISPLSAAADKLGRTTLRCASLQARMLAAWGRDEVRRDGSGRIVEVCPAASLAMWGLPHSGYKSVKGTDVRNQSTRQLLVWALPDVADHARVISLLTSDHHLDALIAALSAADSWARRWTARRPRQSYRRVDLPSRSGSVRTGRASRGGLGFGTLNTDSQGSKGPRPLSAARVPEYRRNGLISLRPIVTPWLARNLSTCGRGVSDG